MGETLHFFQSIQIVLQAPFSYSSKSRIKICHVWRAMKYDESLYYIPLGGMHYRRGWKSLFPHALFLKGDAKNTNIISKEPSTLFSPPDMLQRIPTEYQKRFEFTITFVFFMLSLQLTHSRNMLSLQYYSLLEKL